MTLFPFRSSLPPMMVDSVITRPIGAVTVSRKTSLKKASNSGQLSRYCSSTVPSCTAGSISARRLAIRAGSRTRYASIQKATLYTFPTILLEVRLIGRSRVNKIRNLRPIMQRHHATNLLITKPNLPQHALELFNKIRAFFSLVTR